MTKKMNKKEGTLYGIGVGPGDPDLITLKAARTIQSCPVITYLHANGQSMAREIAADCLKTAAEGQIETPIHMPMNESRDAANAVYDAAAAMIAEHLRQGRDVGFLCQGDPLLFGSYGYILERLSQQHKWHVIPGISSINAAAAVIGIPIALLAEKFAVISGRHDDHEISDTLRQFDNVAIMKPGRRRARIIQLLNETERFSDACYVEYCGQTQQQIVHDISKLDTTASGPYFSLFLVNRHRNTQ